MKYTKWIGIAASVVLIFICFLPWTYHADIHKTFTGFFSEKNMYGRPGKYFVFFGLLSLLFFLVERVWAKRAQLFLSGIIVAYAIKTYILFTSCYNAYCPDKKPAIYVLLICSVVILVVSIASSSPSEGGEVANRKRNDRHPNS